MGGPFGDGGHGLRPAPGASGGGEPGAAVIGHATARGAGFGVSRRGPVAGGRVVLPLPRAPAGELFPAVLLVAFVLGSRFAAFFSFERIRGFFGFFGFIR
ncbi:MULTISPECIES: hypothetical protein [unclassified Streptomyces]|uniref:hypothetical protein n=1 Tax=unclassified Streptomyces TaxID=2593676 RepID=UPI0033A3561F